MLPRFYAFLTDHELISALAKGDVAPMYTLYRLYRQPFVQWAAFNLGVTDEQAKDAFQDALIDFYEQVRAGNTPELSASLKTYLFQIGKHKALNIHRKERRMTYLQVLPEIKGNEHANFMEQEDLDWKSEQVRAAMEQLPDDCRKVLELYYYKEYDMESVAREMGYKNADTAKSKKSLCMKKLLEELKKLSLMLLV